MRLYLSSFRLGDHTDRLVAMVGNDRRTAIIANAVDGAPPEVRAAAVDGEVSALRGIGLEPEEVDLRDHFAEHPSTDHLADLLSSYGLVWVRGGNVFVLRRAAAASGLDRVLPTLIAGEAFVYGGYSAGVCLLAPSLEGLDRCDDPDEVPPRYERLAADRTGLGLLPFAVAPHHRSPGHPETGLIDEVVDVFLERRIPFVTLRDGDVIVQEGDVRQMLLARG